MNIFPNGYFPSPPAGSTKGFFSNFHSKINGPPGGETHKNVGVPSY